ncbi:hypothetical protein ANCDUO_20770 [Ancylostoma duodenale]|uniref:Uncharacterized protein n=1 Tax=Ancylostoma duodenale TaxID=51022 RepID=A0A0C2FW29_9BILA|nr:hypothetical protein ANCDUO_20770 [Ancylostoma duodenale]
MAGPEQMQFEGGEKTLVKGTARWWRGRTSLERILMSAVVLLVLLSAVLLAVILNMDRRECEHTFVPLMLRNSPAIYTLLVAKLTTSSSEVPPGSSSTPAPTPSTTTPSPEPPVCTTTGCVRAANAIVGVLFDVSL